MGQKKKELTRVIQRVLAFQEYGNNTMGGMSKKKWAQKKKFFLNGYKQLFQQLLITRVNNYFIKSKQKNLDGIKK